MNIRCMLPARVAALLVIIAALFLAPAAGQAQAVDCSRCDHFTIGVSPNLNCSVEICYSLSPEGVVICRTVGPGRSITIPCPVYEAWVNTCSGPYYIVPGPSDALCSPSLKFAAGCCGRICNVPNPDDVCTRLEIQPLPCSSISCP
jgi:hypothetical protein